MSGIEQAFKDFVKRVSEKENQEQVSEERGYQYGGGAIGYSEGGYPPVEDPMIANEFGNNSGIMNYPIAFGNLGIRPRVDIQSGMTSSPDPYTKIKMSNQNYGADIGYKMTDNLSATGNIDYNRSSVKQDYNVPYYDQYGNKIFEDKGSMNNVYKSPANIRLGLNYAGDGTDANISINPRSRDLMARINYRYADGGIIGYADKTPASGLALTSVRPAQQEIDDFVNMPIYMGQMMPPASELLANETYQDYVRRKRRETGPLLFSGSPSQNITPISSTQTPTQNITSNLPSDLSIDQIQSLSPRDRIIRALKLAGFSSSDVDSILAKQGFADGGRAGYAGGGKPTREDSPILQINPMEKDIQFSQDPTMEQMPNVGIAAIGLTKKAKDYNRYIKAFESNDPKVFKKWFDSQTKEFSKTKKLAEDAEMFELIPEVARGASKTEKQLANNQLRESMGGYYAQELGPYYSQEIGILDNLIFKAYGGRVSMSDGGLTTTIAPAKGPDSQGVETLFKRRYN